MDRFKLALVSHDPVWIEKMFPDWSKPKPEGEVEVEYLKEVSDADLDQPGEWRFQEKVSPEEAEKILAEMARRPGGSFGLDDMDDEGWV